MKVWRWLFVFLLGALLAMAAWLLLSPPRLVMSISHRVPTANWRLVRHYCCGSQEGWQYNMRFEYRSEAL